MHLVQRTVYSRINSNQLAITLVATRAFSYSDIRSYSDKVEGAETTTTTTTTSNMAEKKPASIPWSTRNKPETKKAISPPSPSASIILVSPTNKVLLLHRVQTSSSFPSAHVFPGGNLEASDGPIAQSPTDPERHKDSSTYRRGAIRELFEESGILLARSSSSPTSPLLKLPPAIRLKGRTEIHGGKISVDEWLSNQSSSAVLDTDNLIPFTRWITPTNVPKRFTTQMYLYFVPLSSSDSKDDNDNLIATSDEVETMAPEWMYASEWIERARRGEIILFPPQFILLSFASQFLDDRVTKGEDMAKTERERRRSKLLDFALKDGTPPWSHKVISPTALSFTRKDGRSVLGLDKPGPELKGAEGVKGDDTRVVLVRFGKEGPREVEVRMRDEVMEELRREQQQEEEEKKDSGSKL